VIINFSLAYVVITGSTAVFDPIFTKVGLFVILVSVSLVLISELLPLVFGAKTLLSPTKQLGNLEFQL